MDERSNTNKAKLSEDKLTVDYDMKDFSENLPFIAKELNQKDHPGVIPLKNIQFEDEVPNDPGVIDFIRRCSKISEAFDIIEYLANRGEISVEELKKIKNKLKTEGLESFGEHKEKGYYERKFRRNRKFNQL